MGFFRKRPDPAPREVGPDTVASLQQGDGEGLSTLAARRDLELRSLGEIYYASARKGRLDTRSLNRKMREIQKLDEQLDGSRTIVPTPTAPRPSRISGPAAPRLRTCRCGATLHPLDHFCSTCGHETDPIASGRACVSCQALVETSAHFCRLCGTSTAATGPVRVRHPLTGQEASFDFQSASAGFPAGAAGNVPPASDGFDGEVEPGDTDRERPEEGRQWIRELERFARPAQVDTHAFLHRGREFLQEGRCREAIAEFEAVLLQNPRDARAQYFLGVSRYKNGDLDSAIEAFERATRIDRNNPDAHNDLGLCYAKKGMRREALEHYMRALHLHAGHSDAHYNLAHLYIQLLTYPEAIRHLQLYLQHSPRARDFKEVTELIEQLQAACSAGHAIPG